MAQSQFGGGGADRRSPGGGNRPPMDVLDIAFGPSIKATLYSDIAERYGEKVAGEPRNPRNKPAQLRRVYDELVLLHDKVVRTPATFEEQRPFIQMLKAKVAYANVDTCHAPAIVSNCVGHIAPHRLVCSSCARKDTAVAGH